MCPMIYRPLCGSDGKTYSNQCEMEKTRCVMQLSGIQLTVRHPGPCDSKEARDVKCDPHPMCPMIWKPVCGSDGKTYSNKCHFMGAQCSVRSLAIAHDGTCKTRVYREECSSICIQIYAPVCGSDGKTYPNSCYLKSAQCKAKNA